MAKINLRNRVTYEVTNEEAEKVQTIVDSGGSHWIKLKNVSFKSGEVTSVVMDQADENENKFAKMFKEAEQERRRALAMTPEQKADSVLAGEAILFYRCHNQHILKENTRMTIDLKIREFLRADLVRFFQDHTNRVFADWEVLDAYLVEPPHAMNPAELGAYKALMKSIFEDKKLAEQPSKTYCPQCLEDVCVCQELLNEY